MCCTSHREGGANTASTISPLPGGVPGDCVHLDILGTFTMSESGNKYVLLIIHQFFRWLKLHALSEYTAELTVKSNGLLDMECFYRYTPNFESQLEVNKTQTVSYCPSSNGQVECYNRVILSFIRCCRDDDIIRLDKHLSTLGMSMRATVNRSNRPNM